MSCGVDAQISAGNPKVSVIIGVYNGERFIDAQLRSILEQTHRNLEIIVCDDGSTDQSISIVRKAACQDSRVTIIRNESNMGLVMNFLKNSTVATGDFFCFSDQDDIWMPDKIEKLLGIFDKTPECVLSYSDLVVCDDRMEVINNSFWKMNAFSPYRGYLGNRGVLKNQAPGCTMMYGKRVQELISDLISDEVFLNTNIADKLDEMPFMHDHLIWAISAGIGMINYSAEPLVRYRQHARNSIGAYYASEWSESRFARCLSDRVRILKSIEHKMPYINLREVEMYLAKYRRLRRPPMPRNVSYFLWMKKNTLRDRLLGILDCMTPNLYRTLKSMKESKT